MMNVMAVKTKPQEGASAPFTDRAFGLAVYSALILLANAFYKRFVGGEPRCKCQRNNV